MDIRTKDVQGKTICPVCKKHYTPELPERDPNDDRCIQDIYPKSKAYQREQLVSGVCSDACWDKMWGITEEEED
jgi:hypothetical protein